MVDPNALLAAALVQVEDALKIAVPNCDGGFLSN